MSSDIFLLKERTLQKSLQYIFYTVQLYTNYSKF